MQIYQTKKEGLEEITAIPKKSSQTLWISSLQEPESVHTICKKFNVHHLLEEDILSIRQRPKIEVHDEYIFMIFYVIEHTRTGIKKQPLSIILGDNFILTFFSKNYPFIQKVKDDLAHAANITPDYLAYVLIDEIVEHYFVTLEQINQTIALLEDIVFEEQNKTTLKKMHELKHRLVFMRRTLWPTREIINSLLRSDNKFVKKKNRIYYRDIYDHLIELVDNLETHRDMVNSLVETYLSTLSNRTNDVMKVLTIFSSVFIPLTFLTGVYGMNFIFMPELTYKFGYPLFWVICGIVIIATLAFFRKKQWM